MTAPRRPSGRGSRGDDERPVLPDITDDERAIGWGDDVGGERDDDGDGDGSGRRDERWYRRERPPHHE